MTQAAASDMVEKVCALVATTLSCNPVRVVPSATLVGELGATRPDCNRLKYELECAFGVALGSGSLDELARGPLRPDEFSSADGVVSAAGLARLRELIPEAADRIQPGLQQDEILDLFYVQTLINLVQRAKRA